MRLVAQRVNSAVCRVGERVTGEIEAGLLVFLAVGEKDTEEDLDYILKKTTALRVFEDDSGKMNLSLEDTGGGLLVIPQFTLYGDVSRGLRPSFHAAAGPKKARCFYDIFLEKIAEKIDKVEAGEFGAMMDIAADNDGPVTILIDSDGTF
jgi:D-tyrosyl-tRNA(Tyr) deacylase